MPLLGAVSGGLGAEIKDDQKAFWTAKGCKKHPSKSGFWFWATTRIG